jgi:hypothetical protein
MGIFRVPYRWLPRTIWPNIRSCFGDVYRGIKNFIRWTPVIWHDFDWDWSPLARIMEYKLRRMSKVFANGHLVGCEKDARRTLICAILLRRLFEDEYHNNGSPKTAHLRAKYDQEYCFKLMGKYLQRWWD